MSKEGKKNSWLMKSGGKWSLKMEWRDVMNDNEDKFTK